MLRIVAIALVLAVHAPARADVDVTAAIDRVFSQNLPAKGPGGVAVVMQHGKVVARRAYGLANVELGVAMQPEHRFRIASISKQLTAVAILQLVDAGKLDLKASITKYLPRPPAAWAAITVAQLLSHTSGLISGTDKPMPQVADALNQAATVAELRAILDKEPLHTKPGTEHAYNNWGYALLGQIIEQVTHTPYCDYIAKKLLVPLGMTHTTCAPARTVEPGLVNGYNRDYGRDLVQAPQLTLGAAVIPAGGWVSTVDDLARWSAGLHGGTLISKVSYAQMITPTVQANGTSVPYGFGTRLRTADGRELVLANGDFPGFHSEIAFDRTADCIAIVLFNTNAPYPFFTRRLLAIARGEPLPDPPAIHVIERELRRLVGSYSGGGAPTRYIELDQLVSPAS